MPMDYRRLLETDSMRYFVSHASDGDRIRWSPNVKASLAKLARKPNDRAVRLTVLDDDFRVPQGAD